MSVIRRHGWWVSAVCLLAVGVFVPAPRLLRVGFGVIGFGLLLMNVWVTARQPDISSIRSPKPLSPRTRRFIYTVLVAGGVVSAGYLIAAATGHGGLEPDYSAAQLDSGKGQFGNANAAVIGAAGFYIFGTLALFSLPWMPRDLNFRPGPAIATVAAFNAIGVIGYVLGRALFA